jgi:predicted nucleic acid-binding protein
VKFWDSSAFTPLVIKERESERLAALSKSDSEIVLWWGTRIEVTSAVCRRERDGALNMMQVGEVVADMLKLIQSGMEIQPSEQIRELAIRFLRVHPLRAADAFQLAAAFHASEGHPPSMDFVCLDVRLSLAAAKEGFRVLH